MKATDPTASPMDERTQDSSESKQTIQDILEIAVRRERLNMPEHFIIGSALTAIESLILDYGSWLKPRCDLHEKYTSACCGCQKASHAYFEVDNYRDYIVKKLRPKAEDVANSQTGVRT